MRSPFSVFKRKDSSGNEYFAVRFFDSSGNIIKTAVLKHITKRVQAIREAEAMLNDGIIANEENPAALDYFYRFWTRESDYVRGRKLRGTIMSDQYLYNSILAIRVHLSGYLKNKKILDITPAFLERVILDLSRNGKSPRRINIIMQAVKVPCGYFYKMHRMVNPLVMVEKLKENTQERGILTMSETEAIRDIENENPRVMAAVLLGFMCGLRMGEVRGLQIGDIDFTAKVIHVRHNIVDVKEGSKPPKCGSTRTVPAPDAVLSILSLCLDLNPYTCGKTDLILWNEKTQGLPFTVQGIRHGFYRILKKAGISKEAAKERNLTFHSLRHTYVSHLRTFGIPDFLVQRFAGHSSLKMTEHYSHVSGTIDFEQARAAFEKIRIS